MKAACLLLALASAGAQEPLATPAPNPRAKPQIQGRIIRVPGVGVARGVSAYLPADGDGNRYYYSRSTAGRRGDKGFSETTIQSWSAPDGRPLRAHYVLDSAAYKLDIKLTIEKSQIVFDETLLYPGQKPSVAHVAVPIPADTLLQLSQFHPMDLPLGKRDALDFTLVDPVSKRADRVRLVRLEDGTVEFAPQAFAPLKRYRIEGADTWTEIDLAEDGQFQRMENGKGYVMRAASLTDHERVELREVLAQARR
jgi:hypothetical protein